VIYKSDAYFHRFCRPSHLFAGSLRMTCFVNSAVVFGFALMFSLIGEAQAEEPKKTRKATPPYLTPLGKKLVAGLVGG
jgi:hypothetical protein